MTVDRLRFLSLWFPVGIAAGLAAQFGDHTLLAAAVPYALGLLACWAGFRREGNLHVGAAAVATALLGYALVLALRFVWLEPHATNLLQVVGGATLATVLAVSATTLLCCATVWSALDLVHSKFSLEQP
ncbi:hypothetical protein [Deinococcus aestuarii]|uniref:hypothetical protein n=1 Tax=Deinococcus aestuarii TaxID=2774531 RepID=UPI001C0C2FD5|nr:hypothetical protein [Deinococcus aestuarii]